MIRKTCKICGEIFLGRSNKIYCSVDCRREAERRVKNAKTKKKVCLWPEILEHIKQREGALQHS